jgi:putative flippase GtrA
MYLIKQFSRYLLVGAINSILGNSVLFGCMYLLKWSPELSNIAGYSVGLISSYVLNKKYTFVSVQSRHFEMLRFLIVFAFAYLLNFLALLMLIYRMNINEGLSQILAGIVYLLISYVMNKHYVFKNRLPTKI